MGTSLVEGWTTQTGPTPTGLTGPEMAFEGSHYLYMETSGPAGSGASYSVSMPMVAIPTEGSTSLNFALLMYGADMGSLNIEVLSSTGLDTIFTQVGERHADGSASSWEEISVDLSAYAGTSVQIQFTGMKMISGVADIAIDDVKVCYSASVITVPTLGEWSFILMVLLISIIGVASLRVERRAVA